MLMYLVMGDSLPLAHYFTLEAALIHAKRLRADVCALEPERHGMKPRLWWNWTDSYDRVEYRD